MDKEEIKNAILADLFNSDAFMNLNTQVTNTLFPIKDEILGQAVGLLDKVNEVGKDYLDEAAGGISSVEKNFKDVIGVRAASLEGYAVISGEVLEKLHIDAALALAIPDDMEFKGFLDMTRYQINNEGENCFASLPGASPSSTPPADPPFPAGLHPSGRPVTYSRMRISPKPVWAPSVISRMQESQLARRFAAWAKTNRKGMLMECRRALIRFMGCSLVPEFSIIHNILKMSIFTGPLVAFFS